MSKKVDEIINAKQKVMKLLEEEPATRNSDKLLLVRFYEREFGTALPELRRVFLENDDISPETIRRTRQKLQADNPKLKAIPSVQNVRDENETIFRTMMKE